MTRDRLEEAFLRLRAAGDADEYVPMEQVIEVVLEKLRLATEVVDEATTGRSHDQRPCEAGEGCSMTFEQEKAKRRDDWVKQATYLVSEYDASISPEDLVDVARYLLSTAHAIAGVSCQKCQGYGYRAYGSTATWRGGIGGQAITTDVCDECWGSGRHDVKHGDQRQLRALLREQKT